MVGISLSTCQPTHLGPVTVSERALILAHRAAPAHLTAQSLSGVAAIRSCWCKPPKRPTWVARIHECRGRKKAAVRGLRVQVQRSEVEAPPTSWFLRRRSARRIAFTSDLTPAAITIAEH